MSNTIFKTPISKLKNFENLFIELTAKSCNQRCRHCYIDFPLSKTVKDFISFDVIKKALQDTRDKGIKCIYLTGAEPMTHPEFNNILRTCLKYSNVCICTNATLINEKKARFLKRVEDEGNNEIIFKLSLSHYDEMKNDEVRSRGSYRSVMHALKSLCKYGFNPIICVTNYYNEDEKSIVFELKSICKKFGFETNDSNFVINKFVDRFSPLDGIQDWSWQDLDCEYGRILTAKGVYTCPFLANDHRGRCGSDFKDFSDHNTLETQYCMSCIKNKERMFGINFDLFNFSENII